MWTRTATDRTGFDGSSGLAPPRAVCRRCPRCLSRVASGPRAASGPSVTCADREAEGKATQVFLFFFKSMFIYFTWLAWVLVVACGT